VMELVTDSYQLVVDKLPRSARPVNRAHETTT
jgi:predicted DNA-binding protein (MmcQ/YjbR family)